MLLAQFIFALIMCVPEGVLPSAMVDMFPTHTRLSGVGMGYNLSMGLLGGTTPLICTWLVAKTGDITAPAIYLVTASLVSLLAYYLIPVAAKGQNP